MCGIEVVVAQKGRPKRGALRAAPFRGPDQTSRWVDHELDLTFHRLAIQDVSRAGDQPFRLGAHFFLGNGEIYNSDTLRAQYQVVTPSRSDMEVVLPLFLQSSMATVYAQLQGMFALVLVTPTTVYFCRDRLGIKPLFFDREEGLAVASLPYSFHTCAEVKPGCLYAWERESGALTVTPCVTWPTVAPAPPLPSRVLRQKLSQAIVRRMHSDRPLGCFLSGGLDSSIVAAVLAQHLPPGTLHTFSIGFDVQSADLVHARILSAHIQSCHHEVVVTEAEGLAALPRVIEALASYDTTTVRASTPMFLLSEWIAQHTDVKVVFSGEGSDELLGGYRYFQYAPDDAAFEAETLRLTQELYRYDVLRADRCTSHFGLEFREPFLDADVVDFCLALPAAVRRTPLEKHVLREAFAHVLPPAIASRAKAAFSDAVSTPDQYWFRTLIAHAATMGLTESEYYQLLYHRVYACEEDRPMWRPRWVAVTDPSATLI